MNINHSSTGSEDLNIADSDDRKSEHSGTEKTHASIKLPNACLYDIFGFVHSVKDHENPARDKIYEQIDDFSDETDDEIIRELQKRAGGQIYDQNDDFSDETDDEIIRELQKPNKY